MDKKLDLTNLRIQTMASVMFRLLNHQFIIDLNKFDEFFPIQGSFAVDLEIARDGGLNGVRA